MKSNKTPQITIESITAPITSASTDRRMQANLHPGIEFDVPIPENPTQHERDQFEEAIRNNQQVAEHTKAILAQAEEAQASSGGPYISAVVRVDGYAMSVSLDTKELPEGFYDDPHSHVDSIAAHVLRMYEARPRPV